MCVCPEPGLALCEGKSGAERRIKGKKTEQRRLRGVSVEAPGGRRGVRGREGGKEGVAWHRARRVGGAATALRPSPSKPAPGSGQRGSIPAGWAPAPEPGRPGGPLSAAHAGAVRGRSVGRAGRKRGGGGGRFLRADSGRVPERWRGRAAGCSPASACSAASAATSRTSCATTAATASSTWPQPSAAASTPTT